MPRFTGDALRHDLVAVAAFDALAAEAGITPAQLSRAWVLSRGDHVVAIPGTTNPAHLEEDIAAASLAVAPDILARVDTVFAGGGVQSPATRRRFRRRSTRSCCPARTLPPRRNAG